MNKIMDFMQSEAPMLRSALASQRTRLLACEYDSSDARVVPGICEAPRHLGHCMGQAPIFYTCVVDLAGR